MLTFERYEYSSMQRTVMHPNNTDWLSYIDTQQLVVRTTEKPSSVMPNSGLLTLRNV